MTHHMHEVDALRVARALLAEHGLHEWRATVDNARKRAGQCNHTTKTISLSLPLMAQRSWDETHMTITHEVAHALTPGHHHDEVWRAKHRELGGDGERCFAFVDRDAPWIGTCAHGREFPRYRAPKAGTYQCGCPQGRSPVEWRQQ